MKIGIDISQAAYQGTGVSKYLTSLIEELVKNEGIELILFYSSLRNFSQTFQFEKSNRVHMKRYPFPARILDVLWNRLHILPIELLIGNIDVFISSDWTQPPVMRAKNATILYDLIVYKYPDETALTIVDTQKRKLEWVMKECDLLLCISEATKNDAHELLHFPENKLRVISAGV